VSRRQREGRGSKVRPQEQTVPKQKNAEIGYSAKKKKKKKKKKM
jgi:hypothetical protein